MLITLNLVKFKLRLGCSGSLMSLYGPTFRTTPIVCVVYSIVNNIHVYIFLYNEWPHRQGGCLACWSCKIESRLSWDCTDLYYARGAQGILPMRVGGETSQLDLLSLTPLSVDGCGRLQPWVPHWATSVDYCKLFIIDPAFCGSRFSTGRLPAIEDFTFMSCKNKLVWLVQPHWLSRY